MQSLTPSVPSFVKLSQISVAGADAKTFLQGQLSQDVTQWPDASSVRLASWCTVKGRIWVSFYIWQTAQGFELLVAQGMAEKTLKRLQMFILRSKVTLSLAHPEFAFCELALPARTIDAVGNISLLSIDGQSYGLTTLPQTSAATTTIDWDTAHIQAGVAWISAANSEQFIPQVINFELVGGVNFKKGCYPGQEVVARSQYLGKLRRRGAIARVDQHAPTIEVMSDVCVQGDANPVGSVVMAAPGWVLIECPHSLIQTDAVLTVNGLTLAVVPLPYPILDITQ